MRNQLLDKRFPTALGLIILIIGLSITTFVIKNQTGTKSKASDSDEPKNIKITNLSNDSFTITYKTDAAVTGSISYGKDKKLKESELEDFDKQKENFTPKKIHSISLKKLNPATKYYFTIISGQNTFLNNGIAFEVETAPNIASASARKNKIKGKVILPNGNPPPETLVYLNAEKSQLLSTTTGKDGKFNFSLDELRTENFSAYFDINSSTVLKILATDGSLVSNATTSLNQDNIPTITLSNSYDFVQDASFVASKSAQSPGFPYITPFPQDSKPEILSPKKDQVLNDKQPQFRGTSLPNEKVEIIIHSTEQISALVTSDGNGNWTYKPTTTLSPGQHTVTIKTRDASGILTTLTQPFTVFASELATPSPTPTKIITPTSTPIPTNTPTPTSMPFPTTSSIESKGGLPPTGSFQALYVTIGGIVTVAAGIALFLFTRN
ncbi:MAG: Ig-like domain-containing protein [Candidatus Levybacteria bacterium]|nr:Ig-like domain-containing protein [Candidatus Levybacteria bacterium]